MTKYLLATTYDRTSGFNRNQDALLYSEEAGVYAWEFELDANGGKLPAENEDADFPVFEDLPSAMEYYASHMDDENQGVQFELFAFRK